MLRKGDLVLLSKAEHHANIVPWHILAEEYGVIVRFVELNNDGTIDYGDLEKKLPEAKVVSLTGASNVTGEILDIKRVSGLIQSLSVRPLFILDGSQRFPHLLTNVKESGIDIFIGTGHKVMGDTGIGFFYARKELLKQMVPAFCGGGAINTVTQDGYVPAGLPFRFEPGTPHIAGAVSLLASLEYIEGIGGFSVIEEYERELTEYALNRVKSLPEDIMYIGSQEAKDKLGVFSFTFKNHHPNDIAEMLADVGICVRSGHHCTEPLHQSLGIPGSLRMSLYLYNTKEDIDAFFDKLIQFTTQS